MKSDRLISEEKPNNTNILVIGAGPVGLRYVIEMLSNANSDLKKKLVITLIERNKKYTRKQDLEFNAEVLESNSYLKDKIKSYISDGIARKDSKGNIHIPIQNLEDCLLDYAKQLGVIVEYKRFMTVRQYKKLLLENAVSDRATLEFKLGIGIIVGREEISQMYPRCKIIVGADGARSSVRQLISGKSDDESISKKNLRYLVEIKYLARGKVRKLSTLNYYRSQALLHGFLCSESIKCPKDSDESHVTLRFLVDEKTYNDPRLANINAKNVLPLCADFPLPAKLRKVINTWMSLRGDNIEPGSGTVNKTILSIYSSHIFGIADSMQGIMLLGDAANGFPYMNGARIGTRQAIAAARMTLANYKAIIDNNNNESLSKLMQEFNVMTHGIFDEGFKIVESKDREITNQKRLAKSVALSSTVVKVSEQCIRERDNSIFLELSSMYSLDLNPLNNYVEKYSGNKESESYLLSMSLLVNLIKHQRLAYQHPELINLTLLKTILSLAFFKNQAIIAREKNRGFLSSLNKFDEEIYGSKKIRCEITDDEIENALKFQHDKIHRVDIQDEFESVIYELSRASVALEYRLSDDVRAEEKTELEGDVPAQSYWSRCSIS